MPRLKQFVENALPFAVGFAVLAVAAVLFWLNPPVFQSTRNLVFDSFQQIEPRDYVPVPVRILDIDEESIRRFGQWPWDRRKIAAIIRQVQDMGAAALAFDVLFSEPDRTSPQRVLEDYKIDPTVDAWLETLPDNDDIMAAAIKRGRVVTAFVLTGSEGGSVAPKRTATFLERGESPVPYVQSFSGATKSLDIFEQAAAGNGSINFLPYLDGVIRTVPLLFSYDGNLYPSLSMEALRVAQGQKRFAVTTTSAQGEQSVFGRTPGLVSIQNGALTAPLTKDGQLYAYYTEPVPDRTIPIWKVVESPAEIAEKIAGHIVFVGTSAAGLQDLRFTPLGVVPGVEAHAQAIEQILTQTFLERPEWALGAERLYLVISGILVVIVAAVFGAIPSALFGGVVAFAAVAGSWYVFSREQFLIDMATPSILVLVVFGFTAGIRYYLTDRKQRFVREAFSSYVSPNLVSEIVKGQANLTLGGERRVLSFIFTDLESFTNMIETSDPDIVMPILNDYLDRAIGVTFDYNGTLDKVVGDALHIMFSAPVEQKDHAQRAIDCALALDDFAEAFRAEKNATGFPLGRTRIGINTGEVLVGNFGGDRLFDYTAHGDAINVAARLEAANKKTGTRICVSEDTINLCTRFDGRPIGNLMLKGKSKPTMVYEPLRPKDPAYAYRHQYADAFALLDSDAGRALQQFKTLHEEYPDDTLVAMHLARLESGESGTVVTV